MEVKRNMKESIYKDYGELLLFLNAATVAKVLGVSPSSGYELMHIVVTNSVSLAPPQAAGLAHSVAPPLPTQTLCVCAGSPFFPVLKIGSRLVVPKEKFVEWVSQHTQSRCVQDMKKTRGNVTLDDVVRYQKGGL